MTEPWGLDEPSADTGPVPPLPPHLALLAEVERTGVPHPISDAQPGDFPRAEDLPEVQQLMHAGWRPNSEAPLDALLPAAWPTEHRRWVPDRLPKVAISGGTGADDAFIAMPAEEWHDEHLDEQAAIAGIAPPPPGRIWLLRSPWPRVPLAAVHATVWSMVEHTRTHDEPAAMYRAALEAFTWDEERAIDECPIEIRELLAAWASVGRTGEDVGAFVELELSPSRLADAQARTGLDESALLSWSRSLDDFDDDSVEFLIEWRERGLPGDPPEDVYRFADRDLAELTGWIRAGFDLDAAVDLERHGLPTAIRWREAGFSVSETRELLDADSLLTPEEALAFEPAARRREWIYYGFPTADAKAWTAAGLTPYLARIWRACGRSSADVVPGQELPPQLLVGRTHLGFSTWGTGERRYSEFDDLPDPPGTRGRYARQR